CGAVVGTTALVMSFGMPAIGGVNQAAATTLFAPVFSVRIRQSVAAYSAAGSRTASRMDDSCVLHRFSRRNDPADRWSLFRHGPVYSTDTLRVLRYRVLDWFRITFHRCGSLDSMDSTTGIQNIFLIPEKGNLPWRCLITSSSHRA